MIIELKEQFNLWFLWFCYDDVVDISFMLKWVGINLYLVNRCLLIKYDQLKMLTAINPSLS